MQRLQMLFGKRMMNSNNQKFHLFALHGFLGNPTDWQQFPMIDQRMKIEHEDLSFWAWTNQFNAGLPKKESKNIILGYSLGGRLAMHALLSNPDFWDAAIFISAHPGLINPQERALRLQSDQKWAERFLVDNWENLMRDWNANPVFGGRNQPFIKEERNFDRKKLALQLVNWSLGSQQPLLSNLKELRKPMLVLAGLQDTKFCLVADQFRDFAQVEIISESAHRVPWDQPIEFQNQINQFIEDILHE